MCIPHEIGRLLHKKSLPPALQYQNVINQTICRTEYGYISNDLTLLCSECSFQSNSSTPQILVHHKLLLAYEENPLRCHGCHTPLHFDRPIEECLQCRRVIFSLINYLRRQGAWNEEAAEPTVLYLSTDKGPRDLILSPRLTAFSLSLLRVQNPPMQQ